MLNEPFPYLNIILQSNRSCYMNTHARGAHAKGYPKRRVCGQASLVQSPSIVQLMLVLHLSAPQVVARWLDEFRVASSIPGEGRQQCWGCKHCLYPLFSARGIKSWALCVVFGRHKRAHGRAKLSTFLPCGAAVGHSCLVTLTPNQPIFLHSPHIACCSTTLCLSCN